MQINKNNNLLHNAKELRKNMTKQEKHLWYDFLQHYTPKGKSYDEARTEILEKYGLYVMRFSNRDIDEKFKYACSVIDNTIKNRIK